MLSGTGVLSGLRPKGPRGPRRSLRGLKAVTDIQGITLRKPPCHYPSEPLRGAYDGAAFAHFDTKKFGANQDRPNLPGQLFWPPHLAAWSSGRAPGAVWANSSFF